MAKVENKEET